MLKSQKESILHPIQSDLQCRLKWAHSTVFLTKGTTASCHRVNHDKIPDNFDFHNTPEKLLARQKMLDNVWPEKGCEHCRVIEDAGGMSDRMLHLDGPFAPHSPPELLDNPQAVHVSPSELEIYFSNNCNLSCIYCGEHFSSTWQSENTKFGHIDIVTEGVSYDVYHDYTELSLTEKMFSWLEENLKSLRRLYILGGEPFKQPQSDRLIDLLSTQHNPDLNVTFFSNLSVDHNKTISRLNKIQKLIEDNNICSAKITGSIDCWGAEAEYVRFGLDIELFEQNMRYIFQNTDISSGINICWMPLTTFTMPDLIEKANEWNEWIITNRGKDDYQIVHNSLMQAAGRPYVHPSIFGPKILDWGYNDAIDKLQDFDEDIIISSKEYYRGIATSIEKSTPDKKLQKQFHIYLTELDKRRGTNYKELFPVIYDEIHS